MNFKISPKDSNSVTPKTLEVNEIDIKIKVIFIVIAIVVKKNRKIKNIILNKC